MSRLTARLAVALVATFATSASAQPAPGIVEGVATSAADGTPIAFALVRLLPAQPTPDTLRVGAGAQGRFRFPSVPAGEYRLQLLRIGYQPVLSAPLAVRAGETLRHDLRGATQAVQLAAVRVRANPTCLTSARLAEEPRLATLWGQVRDGVETRLAFERQYRFTRVMRQDIRIDRVIRGDARQLRIDTTLSEPDSVTPRLERRNARNRERGYMEGNLLSIPYETELLTDGFMRDHCLETEVMDERGLLGIRFRPAARRKEGADVRGTVWVEGDSFQIRRLDVEHLRGDDPFSWMRIDYDDVVVDGSSLRMPIGGHVKVDLGAAALVVLVKGATADLRYTYSGFELVRGR